MALMIALRTRVFVRGVVLVRRTLLSDIRTVVWPRRDDDALPGSSSSCAAASSTDACLRSAVVSAHAPHASAFTAPAATPATSSGTSSPPRSSVVPAAMWGGS